MASTTAWTAGTPSEGRRRRFAIVALTLAFFLTGSAVALVAGSLTSLVGAGASSGGTAPPDGGPSGGAVQPGQDEEPAVAEPVADDPNVDGPVVAEPAMDEPVADEPAVAEPVPDEPVPDEPEVDEPVPDEPVVDEPVVDESVVDEPAADGPSTSDPAPDDTVPEVVEETPAPDREAGLTITEVQERLRADGFLIGPVDGRPGQQTTAAVMAFQRVNALRVDGVVGPATTAALEAGSVEPALVGGPDDRIEIDLDAQLLHLVEDGQRIVTMQVSSGNGETYTNASGEARARTPVGDFTVQRRIHGVRTAALGTLYDPLYFYRGFAIHGSPSVPAYPASHGCVRITRADAAWLIGRVPDGMPIQIHGGTHVFTP